jgi:hypothetical protein
MSHPHSSSIPPSPGGQTKTLFYVHGSPTAMLVIDTSGKMRSRKQHFKDEHAALTWCVANQANMAFTFPRDPARN